MEPAVTTQLAGVLGQVTGWDDLGDARAWRGFQASRKPALWLQAVPHSRRNSWQPQATGDGKADSIVDSNG